MSFASKTKTLPPYQFEEQLLKYAGVVSSRLTELSGSLRSMDLALINKNLEPTRAIAVNLMDIADCLGRANELREMTLEMLNGQLNQIQMKLSALESHLNQNSRALP